MVPLFSGGAPYQVGKATLQTTAANRHIDAGADYPGEPSRKAREELSMMTIAGRRSEPDRMLRADAPNHRGQPSYRCRGRLPWRTVAEGAREGEL